MDIYRCQKMAQDQGFDKATFDLVSIINPEKPLKCKWLDAYFGLFQIEGQDGFVSVSQIEANYPGLFTVENFQPNAKEAA